ncbi:MAG TPA: hypothetical protein PLU11_05080 [Chitinophagaceae bacterium]|nr:hypothetical protein [Chitinophagaceae bacterium]HPH30362.1 hypothetical protein [Chitinophagaceae bacterium]HPN58519.1 hypothetical protein [Chitinophagaceae bacterium]
MKKGFLIFLLLFTLQGSSQTVFGYWYGFANVKSNSSANNYLVEMVLQPEKNYVNGIINYYFKNTYRSLQIKGSYNASTRQLIIYDVPVVYHGSSGNFEVDCIMDMVGILRVSKAKTVINGIFSAKPEYKYTCSDISFSLTHDGDASKKDSVMKALSEFKENYQVWKPAEKDTIVAVKVIQRKVVNYVIERQFTERESELANEIEVDSDSLRIDLYDNGEIDGDIVSLFYNKELILFNQKLTHKSIHIDIVLDSSKAENEITLFAENLGLIAPNTALMRVRDGKKIYDLRVSSSLEKNATIRIRKKRK